MNFCKQYLTKTDLVMGSLLVGTYYFYPYSCAIALK